MPGAKCKRHIKSKDKVFTNIDMDAVLGLWLKARGTVGCRYRYLGTYLGWAGLD